MPATLAALLLLSVSAAPAAADPGGPFRRTTPRGALDRDAAGLIIGIPGGRAWGAEGALLPLDGSDRLVLRLAVDDPAVAEAFVRVAWYARADARSRQLATTDSPYVRVGEDRRIALALDPPPGAVAYRVRVLGRLAAGETISRRDAIHASWPARAGEQGRPRPPLTRLATDLP